MEKRLSKNSALILKSIAFYQIAGGLLGLVLLASFILNLNEHTSPSIVSLVVASILYSYSIYCGILLFKKRDSGLKHSLFNQFLQVISFSILGVAFQYASGLFVSAGLDLTETVSFSFNFGISQWQLTWNGNADALLIHVNLFAILIISWIEKLKRGIPKG